jgi:colanic acid/amylovoran biosynthesis protein
LALRESRHASYRERASAEAFCLDHQILFRPEQVTGDDAFSLIQEFGPCHGEPNLPPTVGINLRGAAYAGLNEWNRVQLKKGLLRILDGESMKYRPIAVSLPPSDDDASEVKALLAQAHSIANLNASHSPKTLFQQVQGCRLVITGSYHAAVFAMAAGVPAIGLVASDYYEGKFRGLAEFFPEMLRPFPLVQRDIAENLFQEARRQMKISMQIRRSALEKSHELGGRVEAAYTRFANLIN